LTDRGRNKCLKRTEARKRRGMAGTVWTGEVKTHVERKEKEKREKKGDKPGNGRAAAHGCSPTGS